MTYELVVGLEVHAQLAAETKLFCGCRTEFAAPPNTQVCPVCLGLPGALPVVNQRAVELAIRAGIALGCTVQNESIFARKNYFYPDLAKGYQISQFDRPLHLNGELQFAVGDTMETVLLERIHMEEDAAKSSHDETGDSLVDFNRGGVALIEIVTKPVIHSAESAEAYLRSLRDILMFIGANDGGLEQGSFRCDANVSIRPEGTDTLGTRVELKNINSFRFVRLAIEAERARQIRLVESGEPVVQETRAWDESSGSTRSMRGKEDAHDYRYFPDPDLPPLYVSADWIEEIRTDMPPTPQVLKDTWCNQWSLTPYDAEVLTGHPATANYFQQVVDTLCELAPAEETATIAKRAANFVQSEVMRGASFDGLSATFSVEANRVAQLLHLVIESTISGKIAKDVLQAMTESPQSPAAIVEERGWGQVSDDAVLEEHIRRIVDAHPNQVEQYRSGKTKMLGFFVGQVMKATQGRANPQRVNALLKTTLDKP